MKFDKLIFIGRMQPPTYAHVQTILKALELSEQVIVLFGSSYQPRTIKNPWVWYERATMLLNQIPPKFHGRITCRPIMDYRYNDQEWALQVQSVIKNILIGTEKPKVGIIGCKKDHSSYYLDLFPQWKLVEMDHVADIDATTVRNEYFEGSLFKWKDKDIISSDLMRFLKDWSQTNDYKNLCEEYNFIKDYKKQWAVTPYPSFFTTVDSAVIQSGHILLVQRRAAPGKGLWALPGGFVGENEFLRMASLRELREETKLKVPTAVLTGSLIGSRAFDNPNRSLRGRTITHAFVYLLPNGQLSPVKGSDDAAKAKWFPLDEALSMGEFLFEDHADIIRYAIDECSRIGKVI